MQTCDFHFDLPQTSIANKPLEPRDSARLLEVSDNLCDRSIKDLPSLLRPDDVLVFNNTHVIPARLNGKIGQANVEITLHQQTANGDWKIFAKPAKKFKPQTRLIIADNFYADMVGRDDEQVIVRFNLKGDAFYRALDGHGVPPLPPYIKRSDDDNVDDKTCYQTIYAKEKGAVAAPTAGLHFTPKLLEAIKEKGVECVELTLHVGAGTFLPVKVDNIQEHRMHSEIGVLTKEVAATINNAKQSGRRIVAVGTTSVRLLESATNDNGTVLPFNGPTDIFITPGYRFKIVDAMLTNFHLPQSTLFMLVCAFSGMERMKKAYAYATNNHYRFYSYGDACFLNVESE